MFVFLRLAYQKSQYEYISRSFEKFLLVKLVSYRIRSHNISANLLSFRMTFHENCIR
jgi:hypothetical protein